MDVRDYPIDVRADYPQRSSRLWAVLTIFWIKGLALIPHIFCLVFLGIAQFVVALVAQFVVAFKGEYPSGMHEFVTGVLRWQTRVSAFFLTVTDKYPPFSLQPVADYPVDVVTVRPEHPSRTYAIFTIIVEILAIVGGIWLAIWFIGHADTFQSTFSSSSSNGTDFNFQVNSPSFGGGGGLLLRQLAAIPHIFVLFFLGIAAFVLWFVVQWVILFVARFPYGMWDIVAGYVRWYTRVTAYTLGLVDCYPPFSMRGSIATGDGAPASAATPPPPPPPVAATWPQAPAPQPPAPESPAARPAAPGPPAPAVPGAQDVPVQAPQPEPPQAPAPPGSSV
jgi:hypothetical protein